MLTEKFYYLIHLQYLGFRYHGWQKQPNVKTVQHMLDRTLCFIFKHENFKTLGASRTDLMVSAHHHLSELFITEKIDTNKLLIELNRNLPGDIRAIKIEETDQKFNIIGCEKIKEYHYYFCHETKPHPFSAPFLVHQKDKLDIELMQRGAKLFEGSPYLKAYCFRPNDAKDFNRKIEISEIHINDILTASFFPKESYYLKVKGKGFLRNQIRIMMGTLFMLGKSQLTLNDIRDSLIESRVTGAIKMSGFIAPASGLHLIETKLL